MGMTVVCSNGCGYSARGDNHRGARLGNCPQCDGKMQGHTAGKAKGRYLCPVYDVVVTLGLTGVQLDAPHRLVFVPGYETEYRKPPPGKWPLPVKVLRETPTRHEQENLDQAGGRVFGPGCVVGERLLGKHLFGMPQVLLVPAPDSDPATWFVNEKVRYVRCAGCGKRMVEHPENRSTTEWRPVRELVWVGNGPSKRLVGTDPGPHPAGSPACRQCTRVDY